ncbi:variant-specific surface protein VSP4A1 [Drosophila rhopaloa]|uniref:Variant-specific surface protein VSP4A1 n=1 Tax=Drosophila rhopaloa TaxID=1041015 RepID=A0A6P4EAU7_DRORH|nr:variant-specific surface protein VSP4A1 [Drosophila rhopaloa]
MRGYNLCVVLIAALIVGQLDSTMATICYNCTSTGSDGNCLLNPSAEGIETFNCTGNCYTSTDRNGVLKRGCLDATPNCSEPTCSSCDGEKCNSNLLCQQCLGLAECAQTNVTEAKYNAVCAAGEVCVNQVNDNQTVTRQCGPACADGVADTKCLSCTSSLCNKGVFPANRRQCYNCTGTECETDSTVIGCSQTDAQCFTTGTSATNMTRGCTSATTAIKCEVDSTDSSCLLCDSDFCNNVAYQRDAGSCMVCENCSSQQNATQGSPCGLVTYQQAIGCYTITFGATVKRGCLSSLEGECTEANSCTSCTTSNCNVAAEAFKCIACISNQIDGCWTPNAPANETFVTCPSEKCFSGVWNNLAVRDCFSAASQLMQYQCDAGIKDYQCTTCSESGCNKNKLNGASSLSQMGVVGLLMALMLTLRSAL